MRSYSQNIITKKEARILKFTALILFMALPLFACRGGEKFAESKKHCATQSCVSKAKKLSEYEVHFIYPDRKEIMFKKVANLEACRDSAENFASEAGMLHQIWDYRCVRVSRKS